ncbi:hypothetical protein [Sporofaciens musculi]|uniref:hypothetical protein n=1 Tax=Sporofaciens musculi TaxID=2681861 RepID=UPI00256FEA61|nr:hypothetical protein [Sporofaciens musculi]
MVCDCCGRKKKLFESFATVQTKTGQLHFCVDCNDLAYKVRDDANEMNKDSYNLHLAQWGKRAKKPSKSFIEWQEAFIAPLEKKLSSLGT